MEATESAPVRLSDLASEIRKTLPTAASPAISEPRPCPGEQLLRFAYMARRVAKVLAEYGDGDEDDNQPLRLRTDAEVLERVAGDLAQYRYDPLSDEAIMAADREATRRYRKANSDRYRRHLDEQLGARYRDCTLDSYQVTTEGQQACLKALRGYASNMAEEAKQGRGIFLFGSAGTGKDHLLAGLGRLAIQCHAVQVEWVRGADIFAQCRASIREDSGDDRIVGSLSKATVLIVSDPLPPIGALTGYQAEILYRIIDTRYRELRPTWATVNVASGAEADQRMARRWLTACDTRR